MSEKRHNSNEHAVVVPPRAPSDPPPAPKGKINVGDALGAMAGMFGAGAAYASQGNALWTLMGGLCGWTIGACLVWFFRSR